MKKLKRLIKTKEDVNRLMTILSDRVKNNQPISDNAMYDGLAISFLILRENIFFDIFREEYSGRLLDGTIQQVEVGIHWLIDNEDSLVKLLTDKNTLTN
jgi:hypothetical protein